MSIVYAIPSLQRSKTICNKSLKLLVDKYNVPHNDIYIFVIKEEFDDYKRTCGDANIIIGPLGLHNMRNHIRMYFPIGTKIVSLDDDISDMMIMKDYTSGAYKLTSLTMDEFNLFIRDAFDTLVANTFKCFGIYPIRNGYFMKGLPYKSTNLRFCVGAFWGCINEHDTELLIHIEEKEDFERTLLYYKRDNGILRYNTICPCTNYYKEKGGMQSRNIDRIQSSKEACTYLLEKFPQYCKLYTSKKSGIHEVRLKDTATSTSMLS